MILAIDVGNTNIVLGCLDDNRIYFSERLSTTSNKTVLEYAIVIKNVLEMYQISGKHLDGSIISSVVPPVTNMIQESIFKITGTTPLVVGPGVKTGLNILMDNPAQLGSDLVVDAVAAIHDYSVPAIVIDMGTATTVSVINQEKNYVGGMILPGIRVSLDSLVSNTSQLTKVSLDPPKRLIGKNTIECLKSGIIHGNASCIDGLVNRIETELGEPVTVIATGGLAPKIVPYCKHKIILDDTLLLKGLLYIYDKNQ